MKKTNLLLVRRAVMLLLLGVSALSTWAGTVNLSTLSGHYTAQNGDVLTGTLNNNFKISIANGATVILQDVIINGVDNSQYDWAGITCLGNATIILSGTNEVKGFYHANPGILAKEDCTLTIMGSGSLKASSNSTDNTDGGAGIGSAAGSNGGNIVIKGGTIIATGGNGAAGIGSGNISNGIGSRSGDITICGGNVTATGGSEAAGIGGGYYSHCGNITISFGTITAKGGQNAAGIGTGLFGSCGNITITDKVISVSATKDGYALNSIGIGGAADCGTLTIGGTTYGTLTDVNSITESPYTYTPQRIVSLSIGSTDEWNAFAYNVNNGIDTYAGKTIKLTADIDAWTTVGTSTNKFKGKFDGGGHTINLALCSDAQGCAPFSRVEGATIQNLKTTGKVTLTNTNAYHASGMVGYAEGVTIRNCHVKAAIEFINGTSTVHSGGFIGHAMKQAFTMKNCLFDGSIGYITGSTGTMTNVGGLVGWDDSSTPNITYCLNAGTFVNPTVISKIARVNGRGTISNCYSTINATSTGKQNDDRGTYTTATGSALQALLSYGWKVSSEGVVPIIITDLSAFTDNYTAQNGDVLTDILGGNYKISIVNDATIRLQDATINGVDNSDYKWAGITCLGNATIILEGNNTVKGFYQGYSGIYVPEGKTVRIQGDGQLDASAYDYGCGIEAAGNLIIEGGTINATGGRESAGIGSGSHRACGNITITTGVNSVTATKGIDASNSIGEGMDGNCGNIIIGGIVAGSIAQSPVTYIPSVNYNYTVHFDKNGGDGTMADQQFLHGIAQNLAAISYTYNGHPFLGWATTPTGDVAYADRQNVVNLTNTANTTITLYAQWGHDIDLSAIIDNFTATNGAVLSGTLEGNYKISIADGATVTLDGVNIPGRITDDQTTPWAGITCLGNAVIILADNSENVVNGYSCDYPGIQAGPKDYQLTIRGEGSLTATTGKKSTQYGDRGYAAGIGGGNCISCGDILIEGGTITAIGNYYSAGIGAGRSYTSKNSCGNITISGGIINASSYMFSAGIGSGYGLFADNSCGDITITGGTVTATGGNYGPGIGSGSICGKITISGGSITATGTDYAAGIGSTSHSECGDIIICGGTVEAIGGNYGAGIGSSAGFANGTTINQSTCGNITITNEVTCVTATGGINATNSIGRGGNEYSSCGTVTIDGVVTGNISQSPYTTYPYTVVFDANGGEGAMTDMTFMYNIAHNLTSNTFTNTNGAYIEWNTQANGSGTAYANEQSVSNLVSTLGATATLYAQWQSNMLREGAAYLTTQESSLATATYTKTLGEGRVGKHQGWLVPFDYTITADAAEKFNFYKINMIANAPAPGEGQASDEMWVFLTQVGAGTVLHANMPYVYKPLVNIESYDFTTTDATLKPRANGVILKTETAEDVYSFYAVYENTSPSTSDPFYYVNYYGSISLGDDGSLVTVGPYRWIIRKTSKFGNTPGYARSMHFFDNEEDSEATSISEVRKVEREVVDSWYSLDGRKLNEMPTQPGLYIRNGQKIVVK